MQAINILLNIGGYMLIVVSLIMGEIVLLFAGLGLVLAAQIWKIVRILNSGGKTVMEIF